MANIKIYTKPSSSWVELPSPIVLEVNNELIWSSNTGRSIGAGSAGLMVGDVIANKRTVHIEWGVLTNAEFNTIANNMPNGFFPFRIQLDSSNTDITVYHGTLKRTMLGSPDSDFYSSAQVDVIEQ